MRNVFVALSILISLVATGCGKKSEPQATCGFIQNQDGQRVSWKTNGLVKLYYDQSVPADMYAPITLAIRTWEATIGRRVFDLQGPLSSPGGPRQDGYSVLYWLSDWDPARVNIEQARTDIYWIGNQLTEADIAFNAKGFRISAHPGPGEIDAQSLVLHELGHVLGLGHTDDRPSVMAHALPYGTLRQDLKPADSQAIKCEY